MNTVLQFILDLFRNENAAQAFVANPKAALADAGLADVTPQQLQSVAATAVPGLELAPADPIDTLSPREREILRLIAAHLQSKEIARAWVCRPRPSRCTCSAPVGACRA